MGVYKNGDKVSVKQCFAPFDYQVFTIRKHIIGRYYLLEAPNGDIVIGTPNEFNITTFDISTEFAIKVNFVKDVAKAELCINDEFAVAADVEFSTHGYDIADTVNAAINKIFKPKYNGFFKMLACSHVQGFTAGKDYEVENGLIRDDYGNLRPTANECEDAGHFDGFCTFEEIADWYFGARFNANVVEIVEIEA